MNQHAKLNEMSSSPAWLDGFPSDQGVAQGQTRALFLAVLIPSLAIIAGLTVAILAATGGIFVYTMDDPYIHLALSEHIANGHYGINAGERSSPASSILYLFLLAIGAGASFHHLLPLGINILGTVLALWALARLLVVCGLAENRGSLILPAALIVFICLFLNVFGVIFGGLEHSVHIALSLVVLLGLVLMAEGQPLPRWLVPAIVLTPLFRFEGLALAGAASVALFALGKRKQGVLAAVLICAAMVTYVATMVSLGLPPLPTSVLMKSQVADAGVSGGLSLLVSRSLATVQRALAVEPGARWLVFFACAALAGPVLSALMERRRPKRGEVVVAAVVVAAMLAHLAAGAYGWIGRYEVYALALGNASLFYLHRPVHRALEYAWFHDRRPLVAVRSLVAVSASVAGIGWMGWPYFAITQNTALGSRNIFEQQYQMSRFAREFYGKPVAVNDLGLVVYRNPDHVLDLVGLGSETARLARKDAKDSAWIAELTAQYDVGLAMVFPEWFKDPPKTWAPLAVLHLGSPRYTTAFPVVMFYRTKEGDAEYISQALDRFAPTLPSGVRLERLQSAT